MITPAMTAAIAANIFRVQAISQMPQQSDTAADAERSRMYFADIIRVVDFAFTFASRVMAARPECELLESAPDVESMPLSRLETSVSPWRRARMQADEPTDRWIESLGYAIRALHREIFHFRFDYPLDTVPEAGPKDSLHYYLYSEKLSWSVMSMDTAGIPRARGRLTGEVYKPAYIAWWGLINLGHFLRHKDKASRNAFLNQLDWLESHAVIRADGAVVWPNPFDCLQGATFLKAPWISAYDQGLVISALVRGYRITGRSRLLELLQGASQIFGLDVHEHGVRISVGSHALYTELPGGPVPVILDGFLSSLLGLYDLFVQTGDRVVERFFREGIEGLKYMLHAWDYRNKWSWYGAHAYLCPPSYHCLNRALLNVLARLCSEPYLARYAEHWDPRRLSTLEQAEIFLGFVLTKNACRIRHRSWCQSRAKVQMMASRWATFPSPPDKNAA
jgi:hypothetical protein